MLSPSRGISADTKHEDLALPSVASFPFTWPVIAPSRLWTVDDLAPVLLPCDVLSPLWQMLLLGDGSPTRQLALLTGSPTRVRLIDVVAADQDAPVAASRVLGPRIRRRIFLENERGERLMHAVSWWNEAAYSRYLTNPTLPIGTSIVASRLELFRQMVDVACGTAPQEVFGERREEGPVSNVWCRSYLMYVGGQAISLVYEVFSPALQRFLGPYAVVRESTDPLKGLI